MGLSQSVPATNNLPGKEWKVEELLANKTEILKWAIENPTHDHVYHVVSGRPNMKVREQNPPSYVVAGSAALWQFIKYNGLMIKTKWDSQDSDIFFLGSTSNHRRPMGQIDLVHTKHTTVESLLLNFDLPCCRVATNAAFEYWISAHCLASIWIGRYSIPSYLKDEQDFKLVLQKNRSEPSKKPGADHFLFTRLQERIKKYEARGFTPEYNSSSEILPWIRHRFEYAQWE